MDAKRPLATGPRPPEGITVRRVEVARRPSRWAFYRAPANAAPHEALVITRAAVPQPYLVPLSFVVMAAYLAVAVGLMALLVGLDHLELAAPLLLVATLGGLVLATRLDGLLGGTTILVDDSTITVRHAFPWRKARVVPVRRVQRLDCEARHVDPHAPGGVTAEYTVLWAKLDDGSAVELLWGIGDARHADYLRETLARWLQLDERTDEAERGRG